MGTEAGTTIFVDTLWVVGVSGTSGAALLSV
jgi:hypothetical protein